MDTKEEIVSQIKELESDLARSNIASPRCAFNLYGICRQAITLIVAYPTRTYSDIDRVCVETLQGVISILEGCRRTGSCPNWPSVLNKTRIAFRLFLLKHNIEDRSLEAPFASWNELVSRTK